MNQQTVNGILLLVLAAAFCGNAWMDVQRHEDTSERLNSLNRTAIYTAEDIEHLRDSHYTLRGRVLFLETDLEQVLGPNWTRADWEDDISITECDRVSRTDIECSLRRELDRPGDSR